MVSVIICIFFWHNYICYFIFLLWVFLCFHQGQICKKKKKNDLWCIISFFLLATPPLYNRWRYWLKVVLYHLFLPPPHTTTSPRSGDSSVVRAPDSWLKGHGFESLQERQGNFLLHGQISVLTRYPFHPRFTTVARKRFWSFCQRCRWQVTAKHAYTLRMWLCVKWHGAWLYGVHRTCAETAAVSCGTSHASAVSTPLRWILKKKKHTL